MIKGAIGEIVANCMARSTIGGRGRMRRCRIIRLTQGPGKTIVPVVTRSTITGDTHMGKNRGRRELSIRVANVTILARW